MQWLVVQEGSGANDFIAVPLDVEELESDAALGMTTQEVIADVASVSATESIRVRIWDGPVVTFRWFRSSDVVTGVCERVP